MTAGRSKWWWGVDLKMAGLPPLKHPISIYATYYYSACYRYFLLVYEHSMLPVLLHQVTQK